ncbi:MAG: hypothetical protein E7649_00250 [Ruminococcaceae bacterium]|nr:hypothetical protein [Oscillospiraceae bacterium]
MKKILSVLIAAAMLISVLAVCVLPAVAADEFYASNDEFIISNAREDLYNDEDDRGSRPGGVYTEDGFSVNPTDPEYADYHVTWPNNAPYVSVQTLQQITTDGFFMEVRIDDFSFWNILKDAEGNDVYNYVDRWFAFSVWDSISIMPGQVGTMADGKDYGNGIETLIRVHSADVHKGDAEDITKLSHLEWYDDTESVRDGRLKLLSPGPVGTIDVREDGKLYLTYEIKYDADNDLFIPYINGVTPVTEDNMALAEALTDMLYGDCENCENGYMEAYIGFSIQNAQKDGKCSFTVTKMGPSKETATVPQGDESDFIPAKQRENEVAEITPRDPDSDEAEPAFVITGDPDTYKNHRDVGGDGSIVNTEDGTLKIATHTGGTASLFRVSNDVSYDLRDYPYQVFIVKNYCTCEWQDINYDGIPDPSCTHMEFSNGSITATYLAGDSPNGNGSYVRPTCEFENLCIEVKDENGSVTDTYRVFLIDMNSAIDELGARDVENRIHGMYIRTNNLKVNQPGRAEFEILAMACLPTAAGAETWAAEFLAENVDFDQPEDTTAPDEETTAPDEETTAPDEETTAPDEETTAPDEETTAPDEETTAPDEETTAPDEETTAPDEETTKAEDTETTTSKVEKPNDDDDDDKDDDKQSGGCGSVAGFGAMAIVAVAAIGLISFKKKED